MLKPMAIFSSWLFRYVSKHTDINSHLCGHVAKHTTRLSATFTITTTACASSTSGRSRIFQRRGRQPRRWGYQPIIFANFPQKLHENEKVWAQRRASPAPPGSANDYTSYHEISSGFVLIQKRRHICLVSRLWAQLLAFCILVCNLDGRK